MRHSRRRKSSSSLLQCLQCRRRTLFLMFCLPVVVYVSLYSLKLQYRELSLSSSVNQDASTVTQSNATQLTEYTQSIVGVFILVDIERQQPNRAQSLDNCAQVLFGAVCHNVLVQSMASCTEVGLINKLFTHVPPFPPQSSKVWYSIVKFLSGSRKPLLRPN